jgi:hypothetical protein
MTLPGFAAEASLSRTSDRYRATRVSTAGTNQVVPQRSVNCYINAIAKQQKCIRKGGPPLLCQIFLIDDVERC